MFVYSCKFNCWHQFLFQIKRKLGWESNLCPEKCENRLITVVTKISIVGFLFKTSYQYFQLLYQGFDWPDSQFEVRFEDTWGLSPLWPDEKTHARLMFAVITSDNFRLFVKCLLATFKGNGIETGYITRNLLSQHFWSQNFDKNDILYNMTGIIFVRLLNICHDPLYIMGNWMNAGIWDVSYSHL